MNALLAQNMARVKWGNGVNANLAGTQASASGADPLPALLDALATEPESAPALITQARPSIFQQLPTPRIDVTLPGQSKDERAEPPDSPTEAIQELYGEFIPDPNTLASRAGEKVAELLAEGIEANIDLGDLKGQAVETGRIFAIGLIGVILLALGILALIK